MNNSSPSINLSSPSGPIKGTVTLPSSKSIANRYLILQALSDGKLTINNLSVSDDTQILNKLLTSPPADNIYDAHHAGTTSRFLLAYLAMQPGTQVVTGSERLITRPIKPLAEALISMGADVTYLKEEGHLPIQLGPMPTSLASEVWIAGDISSQFITALLLNAHSLPHGLTIHIEGELVSQPYVKMTLSILKDVGIESTMTDEKITIQHQVIKEKMLNVESDWSAASYFLGLVATRPGSEIFMPNLYETSIQGDSHMVSYLHHYGCKYAYENGGLKVWNPTNADFKLPPVLEMDLEDTPDIFQTVATMHSILGLTCMYTGLSTLPGKETNRIEAMKNELIKVRSIIAELPPRFSSKSQQKHYLQESKATISEVPTFSTYQDHRMAMSLALLSLIAPINIEDPEVVSKSFPHYWEELTKLGFVVKAA